MQCDRVTKHDVKLYVKKQIFYLSWVLVVENVQVLCYVLCSFVCVCFSVLKCVNLTCREWYFVRVCIMKVTNKPDSDTCSKRKKNFNSCVTFE